MIKENFILLIFVIIIFYIFILPFINYYLDKNNTQTLENFDNLLNEPFNSTSFDYSELTEDNNNLPTEDNHDLPTEENYHQLPTEEDIYHQLPTEEENYHQLPTEEDIYPLQSNESFSDLNNIFSEYNPAVENFNALLSEANNPLLNNNLNDIAIYEETTLEKSLPIHSTHNNYVESIDHNNNALPFKINSVLSDSQKMDKQHCSVNCCGLNQWTPLMDPNYGLTTQELNNDYAQWVQNIPTDFVGSNFSCNNGNNGNGCVCLSKNILNNLTNHGGNL